MKVKNKIIFLIFGLLIALFFVPTIAFAVDANGDGYDDVDVEVIKTIISSSNTLSAAYDINNPASWDFTVWNPSTQRVNTLLLQIYDSSGNAEFITDFTGVLDISALTELRTIICNDNKNLISIELPSSDALEYVNCANTGITELDVSKNLNLEILYCNNTNISVLDISNNINLIELFCMDTGIIELDLSRNKQIENCILGENISKIIGNDGYEILIQKPVNGTIYVNSYNAIKNTINIEAIADYKYALNEWTGLPKNVEKNKQHIEISLTEDLNISANFALTAVLADLKVDGVELSPTFDMNVMKYNATVENEISKVNISAAAMNVNDIISGVGEKELQVGENVFYVTVTSADGWVKQGYKVTILRKEATVLPETSISPESPISPETPETPEIELDDTPKTGDNRNLVFVFLVAIISSFVFLVLSIYDKSKRLR